ncbi:MAG: DUF4276 family protein [Chitinophagaceae bacterium]
MIRIGLIGEAPNDTTAIRNLLQPSFGNKVQLSSVIKSRRGGQMDSEKFARMVKAELTDDQKDLYVFIRDADGVATEKAKLKKRKEWYCELSKDTKRPTLFLLNIYELEALIFADIDTFNHLYGSKIKSPGDVSMMSEPKDELKHKTEKRKKYHESHCPDIFKKMNLETVKNNCRYFAEFVAELNKAVATIKK